MRRIVQCLAAVLCAGSLWSQAAGAPQTARQALLEMFFSKTPGTFVKHLPAATRAALDKSGALTNLQSYSTMMGQLQTQGQSLQTFETGSVLLSADDIKTGQKADITVENDALRGDRDDIELAFHVYKNGREERTPFMPRITFSMKQEAQVWKLNEIAVTIHLPLADPDLLKAFTEKMAPSASSNVTFNQRGDAPAGTLGQTAVVMPVQAPSQPAGSDATVLAAMRTIVTAEATYASLYPHVGYTCSLSSLDGFGGGQPNERQAMLIGSGLASGKKYGFVFTLSDCSSTPAIGFHLTAAPNANTFGRKAFCTDQHAVIRSSEDGNPATCLASGTPVPLAQ